MSKWDDFFGQKFHRPSAPASPEAAARRGLRLLKTQPSSQAFAREREQIDAAADGACADLLRSWNARQESLKRSRSAAQADSDWRQVISAFRRQVADLNRRIAAHNLKAPSARFRRAPLDADQEISRVETSRQ